VKKIATVLILALSVGSGCKTTPESPSATATPETIESSVVADVPPATGSPAANEAPASAVSPTPTPTPVVVSHKEFVRQILEVHNVERKSLGLAPLVWSPTLADHAKAWADRMARTGRYVHATSAARPGEGESMLRHIAGAYTPAQMAGTFLSEKPRFKAGTFPNISRTGNWKDASHYSQVIWPTTTEVGCGLTVRRGMDYFVCRYAPKGNQPGQKVG